MQSEERKKKYENAIPAIKHAYHLLDSTGLSNVYINEATFGIELFSFAETCHKLANNKEKLKKYTENFYKDYDANTDKEVLAKLISMYTKNVETEQIPTFLMKIDNKYKGDYQKYVDKVFKKSSLCSEHKMKRIIKNPKQKKIKKDIAYKGMEGMYAYYKKHINSIRKVAYDTLAHGQKLYIKALREMYPNKLFYPDANSTMRLTYGNILPYATNSIQYPMQTFGYEILDKEKPNDAEFHIPTRLHDLLEKKEYGNYSEDGKLPVCFISDNDITGGNSGSGVLNAKGELIGIAFDGNWEAMSGDIVFEPNLQRTISVDIRYVLFIIDKYANASNLIKEMDIRK